MRRNSQLLTFNSASEKTSAEKAAIRVSGSRQQPRAIPAFRQLVERYHLPVYHLLWRMLERSCGQARAAELTQETFLRVYRALPRFRQV